MYIQKGDVVAADIYQLNPYCCWGRHHVHFKLVLLKFFQLKDYYCENILNRQSNGQPKLLTSITHSVLGVVVNFCNTRRRYQCSMFYVKAILYYKAGHKYPHLILHAYVFESMYIIVLNKNNNSQLNFVSITLNCTRILMQQ